MAQSIHSSSMSVEVEESKVKWRKHSLSHFATASLLSRFYSLSNCARIIYAWNITSSLMWSTRVDVLLLCQVTIRIFWVTNRHNTASATCSVQYRYIRLLRRCISFEAHSELWENLVNATQTVMECNQAILCRFVTQKIRIVAGHSEGSSFTFPSDNPDFLNQKSTQHGKCNILSR